MNGVPVFLRAAVLVGAFLSPFIGSGTAAPSAPHPMTPAASLNSAAQLNMAFNGVTVSPSGRVFLNFPRMDRSSDVRVAELVGGQLRPYPSAAWNSWMPGDQGGLAFVGSNSLRFGPDGSLWVLDTGMPGMGEALVDGGPKLVQIDTATNTVKRVYPLGSVAFQHSFIDDVRFGTHFAYLSDAGQPGLILLNLQSGQARRVLDGAPQTTAQTPMSAEGTVLTGRDGQPVKLHADQIEVSPDGKTLYVQSASGPMYRVETRLLDDPAVSESALRAATTLFARTGATGGTAMDASGNIYASDTNGLRILKITPKGQVSTLIQDPRLLWVDAMWIDDQGFLWMPAGQLNRLGVFQNGVSQVTYPVTLYKLQIGQKPLRR